MLDLVLFGDKRRFGIELKTIGHKGRFGILVWLSSIAFGDLKKGGGVRHFINSYFNVKFNSKFLYEEKFDKMTDEEIYQDIVFDMSVERSEKEEEFLLERMNSYGLDLGDYQFGFYSFILINLPDCTNFKILITHDDAKNGLTFYSMEVDKEYFLSVFREAVIYIYENELVPRNNFFPKGRTHSDLFEE